MDCGKVAGAAHYFALSRDRQPHEGQRESAELQFRGVVEFSKEHRKKQNLENHVKMTEMDSFH